MHTHTHKHTYTHAHTLNVTIRLFYYYFNSLKSSSRLIRSLIHSQQRDLFIGLKLWISQFPGLCLCNLSLERFRLINKRLGRLFKNSFFVYSKNSTYYPTGAILGMVDTAVSKVDKISSLVEFTIFWGEKDHK